MIPCHIVIAVVWVAARETGVKVAGVMIYIKFTELWEEELFPILNYCCVGDICMLALRRELGMRALTRITLSPRTNSISILLFSICRSSVSITHKIVAYPWWLGLSILTNVYGVYRLFCSSKHQVHVGVISLRVSVIYLEVSVNAD